MDEDIFIWWQEWFIPDCYAWFCWPCQFLDWQCLSCIFHFFFNRLTSDQRWMDECFFECETCYWNLNATIDVTLRYIYIFFYHRFRCLKSIINKNEINISTILIQYFIYCIFPYCASDLLLSEYNFALFVRSTKAKKRKILVILFYLISCIISIIVAESSISSKWNFISTNYIGCASLNFYQCKEQVEWFHAAQMRVKIAFYIPSIKVQNIRAILSLWGIISREYN